MMHELIDAFDRADADDAVRVVIVTGAGTRVLRRGRLSEGGRTFDITAAPKIEEHRDGGAASCSASSSRRSRSSPAINGPAVGRRITMTLPDGRPHRVERGAHRVRLRAAGGSCRSCEQLVPAAHRRHRAGAGVGADGDDLHAEEALAGRLVSRVVAPGRGRRHGARARARDRGQHLAMSVTLARQLLWRNLGVDHPMEAHKIDSRCIFWMGSSADAREGVTAFLEKRPPRFAMKPSSDMPDFYPWWPERKFS
jgi:enoyl-CoA hydratase/carnithine racemase